MIKNIQALRAAAALMVVFVHFDGLLGCIGLPGFGAGGVDLFFVISGFIMVHTTRANPPTATLFMRNRAARIIPIYWVMTIFVYFIAIMYPNWLKSTTDDPFSLLKSLLFVPFKKSNGLIHPVLFVGWTLNYEIFFYLIFSIGLTFKNYKSGLIFDASILVILAIIGAVFAPSNVIAQFYTDPIILEFVLGMIIAMLVGNAPQSAGPGLKLLVGGSVVFLPFLVLCPLVVPNASRVLTAGIPSAILVAGAVLLERWGWRIRGALAMGIGEASYAIYLSHPYIVIPFQTLALHLHPGPLSSTAFIGLSLGLVIIVGYALHRLVERPLSRYARTLLLTGRLEPRPA